MWGKSSGPVLQKITAQQEKQVHRSCRPADSVQTWAIPRVLREASVGKGQSSLPEPSWKAGYLMLSYLIKLK